MITYLMIKIYFMLDPPFVLVCNKLQKTYKSSQFNLKMCDKYQAKFSCLNKHVKQYNSADFDIKL